MRFLDIFSAQHDRLVIGFVMGTKIFEFRPNYSFNKTYSNTVSISFE